MDLLKSMVPNLGQLNLYTAAIGFASLAFLFWVRRGLKPLLRRLGIGERPADILAKVGPVVAIAVTTAAVWGFGLHERGVAIVGTVPRGLPKLTLPPFEAGLWAKLVVPALLISIVGYVESISVALTLAAKRRQRVDADQELIALGMSNVGSAVSGGFPVTGGFARSVVNFEAGAETPAAGAFTAVGIALATLYLTPLLFFLPNATLAATIIVAVLSLVNLRALKSAWHYSRADGAAMAATILLTLYEGVEAGLLAGVGLAIFLHLYQTSKPHVAVVGQLPGTMNFRNVLRHTVVTDPEILSLRVDASLYFPNARFIEDYINRAVAGQPGDPPRRPRMPGGEHDRRLGAGKPRGDQPPAQGRRHHAPPVRGEGPGHGPPQAVPLPGGAGRQRPSDPVRRRFEHQSRPRAEHAGRAEAGRYARVIACPPGGLTRKDEAMTTATMEEKKKLSTVPLTWKEVYYTNCPLVSASNVDQELGWTKEEYKKLGVNYLYLRARAENDWYPHYIHNLDNLIRFGGLFPPVHVQADIRRTRLLGVTHAPREGGAMMVRSRDDIYRMVDLKGRKIGLSKSLNTTKTDWWRIQEEQGIELMLRLNGMTRKDVQIVEFPYPDDWYDNPEMMGPEMENPSELWLKRDHKHDLAFRPLETALAEGEIDAMYMQTGPLQQLSEATGKFKSIEDLSRHPDWTLQVANIPAAITCTDVMAEKHPELVVAFMKGMIKVGRWANEHKHAAAAILDKQTFYLDVEHTYRGIEHIDMVPNLSAQNLVSVEIGKDFMLSHGYIKNDFDVKKWAAPEFLEQAARELLEAQWKKTTTAKLPETTELLSSGQRIG